MLEMFKLDVHLKYLDLWIKLLYKKYKYVYTFY